MYKRIVVPLDGSRFGDYAIRFAVEIAQRAGASIELLHVHVPRHLEHELFAITPFRYEGVSEVDAAVERDLLEAEIQTLDTRAVSLTRETGVKVTGRVVGGRVDAAVETEAEAFHADLIVMATHARTGLDRLRLGSVADQVVRHSAVPVLLVRPPETALSPPIESAFRHVMVPLDGSDFSEQVIPSAAHLATLFDASMSLIHVEVPPGDRLFSKKVDDELGLADQYQKAGQHYLEEVAERFASTMHEPRLEAVVARYPIVALLEMAVRTGADVIAMATHGRGGISRMIVGSTANDLLRGTWLPILLHRPRMQHAEARVDVASAGNTP